MTARKLLIPVLFLVGFETVTYAGERTPGKYSGVIVYDRWGGCTLYSGIFVIYISESVKEKLRDHAGESVQIDAREVIQVKNPGDGLITAFDYLGAAPKPNDLHSVDGLRLHASPAFEDGESPSMFITIENVGRRTQHVGSSELAPTLLTRIEPSLVGRVVADGPSFAILTRQSFWNSDGPRMGGGPGGFGRSYTWRVDEPLPKTFGLIPGEKRRIRIGFDLPEGQYDFLAGYGGGVHEVRGLASNLVAFDVGIDGKAMMAKVKGRSPAVAIGNTPGVGSLRDGYRVTTRKLIAQSRTVKEVTLEVSLPDMIKVGAPVVAVVTLTNRGNEDVFWGDIDGIRDLSIGLKSSKDRPVPFTDLGEQRFGRPGKEIYRFVRTKLAPGSSHTWRIDLNILYNISADTLKLSVSIRLLLPNEFTIAVDNLQFKIE